MANMRRFRWMGVAVILLGAVAAPASAERAQRAELTVECPGPQSPVGYDATNGATGTAMPMLTGALVPYDEAGAEVTGNFDFVEGRQPDRIYGIHVTYQGLANRLTTAPKDSGGHYPSRTPYAGETDFGIVSIVTQDDGVFLSLQQSSSGSANWFVWRIGPSCGSAEPAPAPTTAPVAPAADPVEGTSSYTG